MASAMHEKKKAGVGVLLLFGGFKEVTVMLREEQIVGKKQKSNKQTKTTESMVEMWIFGEGQYAQG